MLKYLGMKVLVVEDDPLISELVCLKLKNENYLVCQAFNGAEGLARAKDFKPSVIILDIAMPIMDGYELLKILRGDEEFRKTPVIMFSNLGYKEDAIEEAKRIGANAFLSKAQLSLNEVVDKVREFSV